MRIGALDDLAVEFENKAQHAMRGRMLRTEVEKLRKLSSSLVTRPFLERK